MHIVLKCYDDSATFEDLKLHGHSYDLFLMYTKVVPGRVQQPITYFRGARDNFMIHDMNNSSVLVSLHKVWVSHGYILKAHKTNAHCFKMLSWQCICLTST